MRVKTKVLIEVPIAGDVDGATGACEGWWLDVPDDVVGSWRGLMRLAADDKAVEPTAAHMLMDLDDELDGMAREAVEIAGEAARDEVHAGESYGNVGGGDVDIPR